MKNSNVFVLNTYGGDSDGPKHVVLHDADGSITGNIYNLKNNLINY